MIRELLFGCCILSVILNVHIVKAQGGEGSGSGYDPCEATDMCGQDQACDEQCDCDSDFLRPPFEQGYCAKPCDYNYEWCPSYGSECSLAEDDVGYSCACAAGYYESEGYCNTGKFFGGEITFDKEYKADKEDETKEEIEKILNALYAGDYFIKSVVLGLRSGSIIASYKLIYEDVENVTDEIVTTSFMSNCTGANYTIGVAEVPGINESYTINCTASNNTIIVPGLACNSENYCDNGTTDCSDNDGKFFCKCKDDAYAKSTSEAQTCIKIHCLSNSDCNDPFGSCAIFPGDELSNECSCMWGFAGGNCKDPWMFVFTITTAGLGLILIIVLTVCICNSKKAKSASKKGDTQDDMNLKNPFIDFQPGLVRAKVPTNLYSVSDSFDMKETNGGGQSNDAYSHAYDHINKNNTGRQGQDHAYQSVGNTGGADYF